MACKEGKLYCFWNGNKADMSRKECLFLKPSASASIYVPFNLVLDPAFVEYI